MAATSTKTLTVSSALEQKTKIAPTVEIVKTRILVAWGQYRRV